MDNTITPRLVELVVWEHRFEQVRRGQSIEDILVAVGKDGWEPWKIAELELPHGTFSTIDRTIYFKRPSRLMAEGGLVGAGATPLEEENIKLLIRQQHAKTDCAATAAAIEFAQDEILAIVRSALLQANEVKRLSNPVDDGAVERVKKHLENVCHEANSHIGMARMALSLGNAEKASKYLDEYCEEHDRLEVRYLGHARAKNLLDSGIIHPTPAYADEIAKLAALEAAEPHP